MRCVIKEIWYKNNLTYTLKITALVNYMYLTECAVRASSQRAKLTMGLIRFRNRTKINLTGLTSSSPGVKDLKEKSCQSQNGAVI